MHEVNYSSGQPLDQLSQERNTTVLSEGEGVEHRYSHHPLGLFLGLSIVSLYTRGIHFGRHLFASATLSFVSEWHRDRAFRSDLV